MRILFTTWAAPSHLFPLVPLAWAARVAGHEVLLAVPPDRMASAAATGLTPVAVGAAPAVPPPGGPPGGPGPRWPADWPLRPEALDPGQRGLLDSMVERQVRIAEAMLPSLLDFARAWRPDVIVSDASSYAGTVAAAVLDVPSAVHQWGGPAVLDLEGAGPAGVPHPAYRRLFDHYGGDVTSRPALRVDPCPPSLQLFSPAERLTVRHVPYGTPAALPAELLRPSGRTRVCVTWEAGAPPAGAGDPLFAAAGELAARGVETVLAATPGQLAALPALPAGVRAVDGSSLPLWLETCSVLVHQGSGGTGLTAAAAGVPQVVVSPRPEQMLTGDRLEALGAGRHLPAGELAGAADAPARLFDAVLGLTRGPAREAAGALRAEVRSLPSPAVAVTALEALAGRRAG
ncbi:nucleotide disphospho-sugar-binding domain-containing protein [Streptomyces goshikiensis]|uniref:nucleotide disphospho-sugar-binding domain-containing protein n=1 Tax=Streptomyces goshikiensis TaxID=1942 RepID=UPI003675753A